MAKDQAADTEAVTDTALGENIKKQIDCQQRGQKENTDFAVAQYNLPAWMGITQQIDALDIMGVNSANYLILPKIMGLMTIMPILVTLSVAAGILGSYATTLMGTTTVPELNEGFRYEFNQWFFWCGMIKAVVYAFIITSVSAYKGYTVEGGSVEVGKSSTDAVVTSSVLVLFSDIFLTNMLT